MTTPLRRRILAPTCRNPDQPIIALTEILHHRLCSRCLEKQYRLLYIHRSAMSSVNEGPNPLRPYYIPPSVGESASINTTDFGSRYGSAPTTNLGSSARNILADMDYTDYITASSPSMTTMAKTLMEQAIWKYTSVFLAQPFEVAKTILQVQVTTHNRGTRSDSKAQKGRRQRPGDFRRESYDSYDVCMT